VTSVSLSAACAVQLCLASIAQSQEQSPSHTIRWWEVTTVVGAVAVASLADRTVNIWSKDHRSESSDKLAAIFRTGGQPAVVLGVGGGIALAGVISDRAGLRRSGERILASAAVAGLTTAAIKLTAGRVRPIDTDDPYIFKPFSGNDAFPSGHATLAFALATSLSDEIHNPWISVVLYTGATGTAWSRINDQRHWLSDVLMGGAIGITGAKIMNGRWRILGLTPPRFLVDPAGARVEWHARF
jgi:membrane-associated phospholipid phosphatase